MKTTIEKDDWLQKELEYEKRINVWRFDDSRYYLQKMHEDDCDADDNRLQHERRHNTYRTVQSRENSSVSNITANRNVSRMVAGFVFLIAFFIITAVAASLDLYFLMEPLVLMFPVVFVAVILNFIRNIKR